ncbi:hypothetical protein [Brevibacillus laterosporus]|uniref:hypothetical protein n=1 Tax=Brevibacillus laterosporus TaxID=1465 RepID=UPI00265644DC|nr:hypothetical protein [Brevibacillus laterosporus]MDN9012458.1 hypothetical protein [Brevibacillus laterosporus]MDO0943479.1 hypothetical protein [Brevibacillus laterosporus]
MKNPYTVYVVFATEYQGEEVTFHRCFENESEVVKYASEISSSNNSNCKITKVFALTESGKTDEMELIFKGRILLVRKDFGEKASNPFKSNPFKQK